MQKLKKSLIKACEQAGIIESELSEIFFVRLYGSVKALGCDNETNMVS